MKTGELSFLDELMYWGRSGKQATVLEMNCVLDQAVKPDALHEAMLEAMRVHDNFRTRPVIVDHRFRAVTDDVDKVLVIREDGRPRHLGTEETEGLMLYATYGDNDFTLHVFHGVADLRGIYAFLKTVLRAYARILGLLQTNASRLDSAHSNYFVEEVLKAGSPGNTIGKFNPEKHDIFHLPEENYGEETTRQRIFEVDIPLDQMLAFTRENESSVIPAWNAVIGKAIRKTYDVGQKDIVCYVPIDLRPVFHFETGRNGVTNFSLPYTEKMDRHDVKERTMLLRGAMDLQIQPENLYVNIATLKGTLDQIVANDVPVSVLSPMVVKNGRRSDAQNYTYGISYPGKIAFGEDVDRIVSSVSACAGSYSYPLWIIACEYNGVIRMKFVQSYESDVLTKRIYEEFSALIPETEFRDLGYHEFDEYPV